MNFGTVLITGGTGSLGEAIVKNLLIKEVSSIRIYSRNEYLQYLMAKELTDKRLRYMIGDIRDKERLSRAMNRVDYVIHTAALKHVPICHYNPIEAVRTNVDGSINIINCAIDNGVKKVLGISTDKAVNPINLYGATKLTMEHLFTEANVYGDTQFSCVRFGNFVGSKGSIIPLAEEKVKRGEKIPLTHPWMTRYWIDLESSAEFCLKCLEIMQGEEIFIKKCELKKVKDFLKEKFPNAEFEEVGIREGEKINEDLLSTEELCKVKDMGDYWEIRK